MTKTSLIKLNKEVTVAEKFPRKQGLKNRFFRLIYRRNISFRAASKRFLLEKIESKKIGKKSSIFSTSVQHALGSAFGAIKSAIYYR